MKNKSTVKGVRFINGDWYIDYRFNGRRIREKIGESKTMAEMAIMKIRTRINEEKYLDIKKEIKILFTDFAEDYINLHAKQLKSYKISGMNNIVQLKKFFGNKYLHEIKVKDVEAFKAKRIKEVAPATVNRQLACLKSMFNRAIEWEMFGSQNPVCKVKMFKENNEKNEFLTEDEMNCFIGACPDYFRPIAIMALQTGMRRGEILNLQWTDLKFEISTIYIREAKSGESRTIRMSALLADELMKVKKHSKSNYVFVKKDGTRRKDLRKPMKRALVGANIMRKIRFHDLRHTCASHLAMKGYSLYEIQKYLGHKTIQVTMRYAHLAPNHQVRMASEFDKILDTKKTQSVDVEFATLDREFVNT